MSAKRNSPPACTPQSWEAADKLVTEYGELTGQIVALESRQNDAVARVKAVYQRRAEPLQKRIKKIFAGLETYATANRDLLTDDGRKKSADMTAGRIGWRIAPPAVKFRRGVDPEVIVATITRLRKEALQKGQRAAAQVFGSFIRTKEEPNKAAMLDNAEAAKQVDGVRIVRDVEEFYVDPTIATLAEPKS